jgi:hypothetical protein
MTAFIHGMDYKRFRDVMKYVLEDTGFRIKTPTCPPPKRRRNK